MSTSQSSYNSTSNTSNNSTKKLQLVSINNSFFPDESDNLILTPIDLIFTNSNYFNSPKNDHDLNLLLNSFDSPCSVQHSSTIPSNTSTVVDVGAAVDSPFKLTANNFLMKNNLDKLSKNNSNELISSISSSESMIDMLLDIDNNIFDTNSTVEASTPQTSTSVNDAQTSDFISNNTLIDNYNKDDATYLLNPHSIKNDNININNENITNVVSPIKRSNPNQNNEETSNKVLILNNNNNIENLKNNNSKMAKISDENFVNYHILK